MAWSSSPTISAVVAKWIVDGGPTGARRIAMFTCTSAFASMFRALRLLDLLLISTLRS